MKKRFLPFSLLLVIMILGQSVMADQGGHYVPRVKGNSSAEAFISSMRVNQQTGLIDPAWMIAAAKEVENSSKDRENVIYWRSMGPDNVGGRTTSIVYNNANQNEVYIGSMGGGVFYTWNKGVSWHQVGDNLMVSCMAQAEDGTIYVGTGDCGLAYDYNGLANINYGTSFIGSGLYTIKDNVMNLVPGTSPAINDEADEWGFINDLAIDGNTVIVATGVGVKYLKNGEWKYAKYQDGERGLVDLTGNAIEVKVASNHTVVASVDGKIYIGAVDNMACKSAPDANDVVGETAIESIGTAAGLLDIAIAPSNDNVIYAASVKANGNHNKFYISEDQGESWRVIMPAVSDGLGHQVYEERGLYNHGLVVDPQDPNRLYVLAMNLWLLERPTSQPNGYYMATQISSASMLHTGINAMAFDPRPEKGLAYIGTDGGIFKANKTSGSNYLTYVNCNRGYISTRCLSVAPSNSNTRVIGGILDAGPVIIDGLENTNNMETGDLLLPALTGAHFGSFSDAYNAGHCFVSLVQPKALILSTVDGALYRTEDGGQNYDFSNFNASFTPTFSGYRIPMAFWESFNDEFSTREVWFKCTQDYAAGEVVQVISNTGDYPFEITLPHSMHYDTAAPMQSDSLLVKDVISSKLAVPSGSGPYDIYYTVDAILFNKETDWFKIASVTGYPTCMTFSADGDNLFIGTLDNGLYRVSNLRHAVDAYTAHPDSADFAPVLTAMPLPTTTQCVTSIAVYSEDANKLVVTLGNYGNDNYVLYSRNALSDTPAFTEKQGNLPKMPVYSSVYTSTYNGANQGHVLIGTEHGVYRTTNIGESSPNWTLESDNMGDVPVLDLKQQLVYQEDQFVTTIVDTIPVTTTYPGTNNQGVIYAATYGRGLFRCEAYRQHSGNSVPETPTVTVQSKVNMYPNPVRDEAKVRFQLNENTNVSYQVYDMSGRLVKVESLGFFAEGMEYEVNVTVSDLAKGAYVLRLNAGSQTSSVKFMVY